MSRPARSLALREFGLRHAGERDHYWRLAANTRLAERFWASIPADQWPESVAAGAADPASPEARVALSPADFLADQFSLLGWARAYALVAIVTSFESYLRRALERALIVKPALLEHFDTQIMARELAAPAQDGNLRAWLARRAADKFIRDRTHPEAYRRLDTVFCCGVSKKMEAKIEEWQRITLLRNAIVHESRAVTVELARAWPDRFRHVGASVALEDGDIDRAHDLGFELAERLDRRYASELIGEADACDLVCQMYWKMTMHEPERAIAFVRQFLNYEITEARVRELHALAAAGLRAYPS